MSSARGLCAALLALGWAGCFAQHDRGGGDDGGPDARAPRDAAVRDAAVADGGWDTGGLDVGMREGELDAGADAGADAGSDPSADAGSDAGADAGSDAGVDAATCPEGTTATRAGCVAITPTAPCDVPGNVLHLEGASWVFTGVTTVDDAAGSFAVSAVAPNTIEAEVSLHGSSRYYRLELSTAGTGRALEVGAFEDAMRYPFSIYDGRNGLTLASTGAGCNQSSGRFDVHRVALEGAVVREVLVSFDFYCERRDLVRGCLHYVAR